MELHCPVICFTKDFQKVLIAKRSDDRKVFPGLWEFGAAKPSASEKMTETIKREYFEDFGINIDILTNEYTLIPYSVYEVERDGELHKGIIFAATMDNPDDIKITNKHSEFKLIGPEELKDIKDEECVPNLKNNVLAVFVHVLSMSAFGNERRHYTIED